MNSEALRIREEYARRAREIPPQRYSVSDAGFLFMY
jgi:hypothetical protein